MSCKVGHEYSIKQRCKVSDLVNVQNLDMRYSCIYIFLLNILVKGYYCNYVFFINLLYNNMINSNWCYSFLMISDYCTNMV